MRDSKKIGVIAVLNNNYGSQLQTFAMHYTLKRLGVDNEVINYKQGKTKQIKRLLNPSFVAIKSKAIIRDIVCKIKYPEIINGLNIRNKAFEKFKKNNIKYSPYIQSREILEEYVQCYSGVILGSDQVWHPANLEMDYFTMSFVSDSIPKIAYAPSFGVSEVPKGQVKKTKQFLQRINSISVREKAGADIIMDLIHKQVPVVCDPTTLITRNEWDEIRRPNKYSNEKYIFCYFLGSNPEHRAFANKIKELTGYKIIALQHLDEFVKGDLRFGDVAPYDIGPDDFISLIADAKMILTDSFHATMFSIYYHKLFYSFPRFKDNYKKSTNSRVVSILKVLNLQNRFIESTENNKIELNAQINWNEVQERLDKFRNDSYEYLSNALKNGNII